MLLTNTLMISSAPPLRRLGAPIQEPTVAKVPSTENNVSNPMKPTKRQARPRDGFKRRVKLALLVIDWSTHLTIPSELVFLNSSGIRIITARCPAFRRLQLRRATFGQHRQ
jgi:hypothetical protein